MRETTSDEAACCITWRGLEGSWEHHSQSPVSQVEFLLTMGPLKPVLAAGFDTFDTFDTRYRNGATTWKQPSSLHDLF